MKLNLLPTNDDNEGFPTQCQMCGEKIDVTSGNDSETCGEFYDPTNLQQPNVICHPMCAREDWRLA